MSIIHVTDDSFQADVLEAKEPVLVDFWAAWCGPCKMIAPFLESLAVEFEGKVKIAKLDIDENPNTPQQYHVRGIPTLIMFKNGELADTQVGAMSQSQIADFIQKSI